MRSLEPLERLDEARRSTAYRKRKENIAYGSQRPYGPCLALHLERSPGTSPRLLVELSEPDLAVRLERRCAAGQSLRQLEQLKGCLEALSD